MMHPHSALRFIDDTIGFGIFATEDIPFGTIVYVKDLLETVISPISPLVNDPRYQALIDKYTYIEPNGDRVLSWDIARYVNHSCDSNTLSTGYGFEIAIRDIRAGEEITDDYGMHNCTSLMRCECQSPNCRQEVGYGDFDRCVEDWDKLVQPALLRVHLVTQPLQPYLDQGVIRQLNRLANRESSLRSVAALRWIEAEKQAEGPATLLQPVRSSIDSAAMTRKNDRNIQSI